MYPKCRKISANACC